jgi:hypothetical protein
VKYIRQEVIPEIKHYIEKGGVAVIIPESFMFDQYAREKNMINDFGISVKEVTLPPIIGKGEKVQNYDQSFSQATLYGEVIKKITCINQNLFSGFSDTLKLMSDGLIQTIDPGKNMVLARFDDGNPAIVMVTIGKGEMYYLAAPLKTSDYHLLLSPIAEMTGLKRPVTGIGNDGKLITGAEVRAVERPDDYLVYACNLTKDIIEFDLKGTGDNFRVFDLRSMTSLEKNHIILAPFHETILRIEKETERKPVL